MLSHLVLSLLLILWEILLTGSIALVVYKIDFAKFRTTSESRGEKFRLTNRSVCSATICIFHHRFGTNYFGLVSHRILEMGYDYRQLFFFIMLRNCEIDDNIVLWKFLSPELMH